MANQGVTRSSSEPDQPVQRPRRLRTACDPCHYGKLRCSGGKPCSNCRLSLKRCEYAFTNTIGRPKGARNKKSLAEAQPQSQSIAAIDMTGIIPPEVDGRHHSSNAQKHSQNAHQTTFEQGRFPNSSDIEKGQGEQDMHPESNSDSEPLLDISARVMSIISHTNADAETSLVPPENGTQNQSAMHQSDMLEDAYGLSHRVGFEFGGDSSMLHAGASTVPQQPLMDLPSLSVADIFPDRDTYRSAPGSIIGFAPTSNESGRSSVQQDCACDRALSLPLSSPCSCKCLQSFAELVSRVRHARETQLGARLDVRMNAAEETLETWDRFVQCPECQHDGTGATLLLAAVALKSTLQLLLLLQQAECTPGTSTPSDKSNHSMTPWISPRSSLEAMRDVYGQAWSFAEVDDMPITIGGYRIRGQGRQMVANSITSHAVDMIDAAVSALKMRSSKLILMSNKAKEQARGEIEGQQRTGRENPAYSADHSSRNQRQDTINRLDQVISILILEV